MCSDKEQLDVYVPTFKINYYNFFSYPLAYDSELFGCLLVFSSTTLSNEENKILMSFRNLLTTFIRQ